MHHSGPHPGCFSLMPMRSTERNSLIANCSSAHGDSSLHLCLQHRCLRTLMSRSGSAFVRHMGTVYCSTCSMASAQRSQARGMPGPWRVWALIASDMHLLTSNSTTPCLLHSPRKARQSLCQRNDAIRALARRGSRTRHGMTTQTSAQCDKIQCKA